MSGPNYQRTEKGEPITPEAKAWQGWGTALKPAFEPVVVGRKPLTGTVAANVLEWGVGGLNIDGTRIGTEALEYGGVEKERDESQSIGGFSGQRDIKQVSGRWPANVILDEVSAGLLDEQSGQVKGGTWNTTAGARPFNNDGKPTHFTTAKTDNSVSGASRFFYVPKASKRDRNEGLEELEARIGENGNKWTDQDYRRGDEAPVTARKNFHPTVKPTQLMRYLIKLVTPEGGVVLDPFTGSGSTGKAALLDGFEFVGAELTDDYLPIIEGRLRWAVENREDDGVLF